MSTIFVDIDGVFVTVRSVRTFGNTERFDPECMHYFNNLVGRTGAQVVVMGCSGQSIDEVKELFAKNKFTNTDAIIGKINNTNRSRGSEIKRWLKNNRYRAPIVIFNDDVDMLDLSKHLIRTSYEIGLTEIQTEKAQRMLRV